MSIAEEDLQEAEDKARWLHDYGFWLVNNADGDELSVVWMDGTSRPATRTEALMWGEARSRVTVLRALQRQIAALKAAGEPTDPAPDGTR